MGIQEAQPALTVSMWTKAIIKLSTQAFPVRRPDSPSSNTHRIQESTVSVHSASKEGIQY